MSTPAAAATRITIITSTLNCAAALVATAASIASQTHRNVQWIVADGGSTDGTVERIRESRVAHWFSEPDAGIYDAWNKACRFIDGDWVLFLGAGDLLSAPDTLERIVAVLATLEPSVLIGYGNVVQKVDGVVRHRYGQVDLDGWELYRPALPAHQGVFARARTLQVPAPFDASYRIAADSKFLLRTLQQGGCRYFAIDVAEWEPGGISGQPRSTLKVMRELLRLEADLGYRIPPLRRTLFIVRSHSRYWLHRLAGDRAVEWVARAKHALRG